MYEIENPEHSKRQPAWCEENFLHVAAAAGCDGMCVLASEVDFRKQCLTADFRLEFPYPNGVIFGPH